MTRLLFYLAKQSSLIEQSSRVERVNAFGACALTALFSLGLVLVGYKAPDIVAMFEGIYQSRLQWDPILFTFLIPAAVLVLESALRGWEKSSLRRILMTRSVSSRIDILCWLLFSYLRVGWVLFYVITFAVFSQASQSFRSLYDLQLLTLIESPPLQFLVAFVVRDFFTYSMHRLQHTVDCLWHGHSVHHSAEELNMVTVFRLNPLDEQWGHLVSGIWLALLGAPLETFLVITVLFQCQSLLIHSEVQTDFGWIGRWLIVSPKYHQIHHSALPRHSDKNFSTQLVIWDRLFGTYYPPGNETELAEFRVGVDAPGHNRSFLYETLITTWRFLESYARGNARGLVWMAGKLVRLALSSKQLESLAEVRR